jgi:hypothetical protein
MLLREAKPFAQGKRRQQRRAIRVRAGAANAFGELRAKLEPPDRETRRRRRSDAARAHVTRCAVAVDEQPLLVIEAARVTRAPRRPQPRGHGQPVSGLELVRRLVPGETHAPRHVARARLRNVEPKRDLPGRDGWKTTDRARQRKIVAERPNRQPVGEPLVCTPASPSHSRS